MHNRSDGEAIKPHIIVDEDVEPEVLETIRAFDEAVWQNPELYVDALSTYVVGHTAVSRVVELVGIEGPRSRALHMLKTLFEEKADIEIGFDPRTEEKIAEDRDIKEIVKATTGKNKREREEEEAYIVRRRRLYRYAKAVNMQSASQLDKAV